VLPLSLGEFIDQRHHFQEQVVHGIAELLDEVEAALKKDVAEKHAQCDSVAAEKLTRDKAATEAAARLDAKIAEVHRLKVALADKAVAFRAARASLAEAEEAKVIDGQKARESEKKRSDFLVALENLKTLKVASPEEARHARRTLH